VITEESERSAFGLLDEWVARLDLGDEWVKARSFEGKD
jgi:hypothetical protein